MASYDMQPSAQRTSEPIYDHAKPRDCPHPNGHSTSDAYFRCARECVKWRVKQMRATDREGSE